MSESQSGWEEKRRREINIEFIVIVFILKEISGKWGEQHIHTILEMSSQFNFHERCDKTLQHNGDEAQLCA